MSCGTRTRSPRWSPISCHLRGHAAGFLLEWQAAGTRQRQASLRHRHDSLGLAMMLMMQLSILTPIGVATSDSPWAGHRHLLGQPWIPRADRHQRCQSELLLRPGKFIATLDAVAVPALIGWFISALLCRLARRDSRRAYHIVAIAVFGLTIIAAAILERGTSATRSIPASSLPVLSAVVADAPTGSAEGFGSGIHRHRASHAHHAAGRQEGTLGARRPSAASSPPASCIRLAA